MIGRDRNAPLFAGLPHWFQTAVYVFLFGVFAWWLLAALDDARERAERQEVELLIRNMRTGMLLAKGEAMIKQREHEIAAWAGSNPVVWLGTTPRGYAGECAVSAAQALPRRGWCFDRDSRQLCYRPDEPAHLRAEGDGEICRDLRWQVVRVGDPAKGSVGLRIEPANSCRWVLEGY